MENTTQQPCSYHVFWHYEIDDFIYDSEGKLIEIRIDSDDEFDDDNMNPSLYEVEETFVGRLGDAGYKCRIPILETT